MRFLKLIGTIWSLHDIVGCRKKNSVFIMNAKSQDLQQKHFTLKSMSTRTKPNLSKSSNLCFIPLLRRWNFDLTSSSRGPSSLSHFSLWKVRTFEWKLDWGSLKTNQTHCLSLCSSSEGSTNSLSLPLSLCEDHLFSMAKSKNNAKKLSYISVPSQIINSISSSWLSQEVFKEHQHVLFLLHQ